MPNLKSALAFACLALAACQTTPPPSAALASALATIPQAELRDLLAELNNAHSQKQQLSFLMTLPLVGADAPFKEFFTSMAAQQAALEEQLRTWADQHHIDLTYHRGTDTMARAQKIMEDRQSKLIQSERRADRTRIALIQMYTDFDFRVGMLQAMLPIVRDPVLKAYIEKSLKIHEDGSAQVLTLLKRYKAS